MSPPGPSTKESRDVVSPEARDLRGMLRRMPVKLTAGGRWQVLGHKVFGNQEVRDADVFAGVGFASRPASGANAESLVAFPGGSSNPIVVATRDEDLRRKIVPDLKQDETAMFNTQVKLVLRNDGTIAAQLPNGTAIALALVADLTILRHAFTSAVIGLGAGGAATINAACDLEAATVCGTLTPPRTPSTPAWPIGTAILKGQ